jgi:hypothetical protein
MAITICLAASANGAISVGLPRSVHADLLAEAKAQGVSLNQLCLSKLVAQLRADLAVAEILAGLVSRTSNLANADSGGNCVTRTWQPTK